MIATAIKLVTMELVGIMIHQVRVEYVRMVGFATLIREYVSTQMPGPKVVVNKLVAMVRF